MLVHVEGAKRSSESSGGKLAQTRADAVAGEPALQRAMNERAQVRSQMQLSQSLNTSSRATAQAKLMQRLDGSGEQSPVQREADEQELLQDATAQRQVLEDGSMLDEDELLDGEPAQIGTTQRVADDEIEPMQLRPRGPAAGGEAAPVQRISNDTGMPDQLKAGIETLSGVSLDGVRVHYDSPKPATLQAHAYAQGSDIHLAAGQERHLPHEAWHVVQQSQGRVRPTMQLQGTAINDDTGLEREADAMGKKAMSLKSAAPPPSIGEV